MMALTGHSVGKTAITWLNRFPQITARNRKVRFAVWLVRKPSRACSAASLSQEGSRGAVCTQPLEETRKQQASRPGPRAVNKESTTIKCGRPVAH